MFSDSGSEFEPDVIPAILQRPTVANHIVQERVNVETSDHEDHTFCGMMFDVKCIDTLPVEFLEITSVGVRGALGPMTVWTTPGTHKGKYERDGSSDEYWSKIYERTHPRSPSEVVSFELDEPVALGPGESCGLFVHSATRGDEAVVYDNVRRQRQEPDGLLSILPGVAALDNRPFGQRGFWGMGWRDRREFVGRVGVGVCWKLWNPKCHQLFPAGFRDVVRTMLLCAVRPTCPLHALSDAVILYILNMCRWDWFGDAMPHLASEQPSNFEPGQHFGAWRRPHQFRHPLFLGIESDGEDDDSDSSGS